MSSASPDIIPAEAFGKLHPEAVASEHEIRELVAAWYRDRTGISRGTNRSVERETAHILSVSRSSLIIECHNFDSIPEFLFLNAVHRGVPYFFSVARLNVDTSQKASRLVEVSIPSVVYRAERRDRVRIASHSQERWVRLSLSNRSGFPARVLESSGDGIGVLVSGMPGIRPGESGIIKEVDESTRSEGAWGVVRNCESGGPDASVARVGLSVYPDMPVEPPEEEESRDVLRELGGVRRGDAAVMSDVPEVVEFRDDSGQPIVGLFDSFGDPAGAPAVLIPAAWGKTKETLCGLAATILTSFSEAEKPISVLRFDGIRKRGESHNDDECLQPGLENLNFTFSQGASDLLAAARFLREERRVESIIIVSFSVASVEARRAVVLDGGKNISGWVSVVGATDPQSLIRIISGGVDYVAGVEKGIRFGRQEVQGLLLDIDNSVGEAISSRMAFLEDSRRDFSQIQCPVTWVAGRNDAWMDSDRIRDAMSFGDSRGRRLIATDSGHQLRSSSEAIEIFGLVSSEVARMIEGEPIRPVAPEPRSLRRRQREERRRLRAREENPDLRAFWRQYLIGRNTEVGMELVTETNDYHRLMHDQLEALELRDAMQVADLGSGLSTFARAVRESNVHYERLRIVAVDYVVDGLRKGCLHSSADSGVAVAHVAANLDLRDGSVGIVLADNAFDRAISSLLLNYLQQPEEFLVGVYSILRPGGRAVLSVLKSDADTSKICVNGVAEMRSGRALSSFGADRERQIDRSLGEFINEAARIIDLEERGVFRFWHREELIETFRAVGFENVSVRGSFGNPPQALLVTAVRPWGGVRP